MITIVKLDGGRQGQDKLGRRARERS
jgi:hypothetical protein